MSENEIKPRREPAKVKRAYADYVAMGDGRTLKLLAERYKRHDQEHRTPNGPRTVPTTSNQVLERWSTRYNWQLRLAHAADQAVAKAEAGLANVRKRSMETGLAMNYLRVDQLKQAAEKLFEELFGAGRTETDRFGVQTHVGPKLWVDAPVKGFPGRTMKQFNDSEVREWRGVLDDLAKEVGDRSKNVKVDYTPAIKRLAEKHGVDYDRAIELAQEALAEAREEMRGA